jgi:hypothetical protein
VFWTWLTFSRKIIFSFWKRCSEALEQYFFETFRFAPRKISRWKNLFVFQRLMFLYQLVNLVLETCFIFSKTLKLSKTFLSWVSRFSSNIRTTSVMIPLFQIIFRISFQESVTSWVFGVFYKVNCGVDLGFLTHLFQKDVLSVGL